MPPAIRVPHRCPARHRPRPRGAGRGRGRPIPGRGYPGSGTDRTLAEGCVA